jgi:hypothetical protein
MQGFDDATSLVTIHAYDDSGTCDFCRKEDKEGVRCTFAGGRFAGFLCRNDFWKFLRLGTESRSANIEKPTPLFDNGRALSGNDAHT